MPFIVILLSIFVVLFLVASVLKWLIIICLGLLALSFIASSIIRFFFILLVGIAIASAFSGGKNPKSSQITTQAVESFSFLRSLEEIV